MRFSLKAVAVAVVMTIATSLLPSPGNAQSFGGGAVVNVRDGGERYFDRRGRRDNYRGGYAGGSRVYYGDRRYYRDRRSYGGERRYYGRSRYYDDRRYRRGYNRGNGVVIRLR